MKKFRTLLVAVLSMVMVLFCFASCTLFKQGKYVATKYKVGSLSYDITAESEEDQSYIELKGDNVAIIKIKVLAFTYDGTGTWKAAENEDNTYKITFENSTWTAKIEGKEMTVDIGVELVLEKQGLF